MTTTNVKALTHNIRQLAGKWEGTDESHFLRINRAAHDIDDELMGIERHHSNLRRLLHAVVEHIPEHLLEPGEDNDPDLIAYVKQANDYIKKGTP